MRVVESGADLRVTGTGPDAVVCVNGGGRAEVAGTWSSTVEWLVELHVPATSARPPPFTHTTASGPVPVTRSSAPLSTTTTSPT